MSMSQDPENFEPLCRLLRLKRYEQPPPGYFSHFSSDVIARIKHGDRAEESGVFDRLVWDAPWLQRLFAAFEAKPVVAGAFGVAVCALLISGVVYSEKADVQPVALIPTIDSVPDSGAAAGSMAQNHPLFARTAALEASSTNPIAGLAGDGPLLGGLQGLPDPQAKLINFTLPGRN
jgi:hypothetical protein